MSLENEGVDVNLEQPAPPPEAEVVEETPKDLRGQLQKNFKADREATEKAAKQAAKKGYQSQARQQAEEDEAATPPEGEQEVPLQPETKAPDAFAKEAKAEWANVPQVVQTAILKREQDMAKGVQELKDKYSDIDKVLAPHVEGIRKQGHTPAEAVNQLFAWMQALAANPDVAFPALARSFGYDPTRFANAPAQQQQQQVQDQQQQQQQPDQMPPWFAQFQQQYEQQIKGIYNDMAVQSQAKTQEILDNWSKGKEHFEAVRHLMAQMITSGAIPLKNGQVDLDAAYDAAIWAHPEVRAAVLAGQEQQRIDAVKKKQDAERKAQAEQAEKARKAAVSVGGGAPGGTGEANSKKPGQKGKSVRESIMEAREQLQG
jgi:hypothetical protein